VKWLERWVAHTNDRIVWRVITVIYVLMVLCIWRMFR
jgi:hypothetical protein